MTEELRKIEAVLDERVRPALRAHAELVKALPELVRKAVVVQTVSDELWEQAKKLLREHHL